MPPSAMSYGATGRHACTTTRSVPRSCAAPRASRTTSVFAGRAVHGGDDVAAVLRGGPLLGDDDDGAVGPARRARWWSSRSGSGPGSRNAGPARPAWRRTCAPAVRSSWARGRGRSPRPPGPRTGRGSSPRRRSGSATRRHAASRHRTSAASGSAAPPRGRRARRGSSGGCAAPRPRRTRSPGRRRRCRRCRPRSRRGGSGWSSRSSLALVRSPGVVRPVLSPAAPSRGSAARLPSSRARWDRAASASAAAGSPCTTKAVARRAGAAAQPRRRARRRRRGPRTRGSDDLGAHRDVAAVHLQRRAPSAGRGRGCPGTWKPGRIECCAGRELVRRGGAATRPPVAMPEAEMMMHGLPGLVEPLGLLAASAPGAARPGRTGAPRSRLGGARRGAPAGSRVAVDLERGQRHRAVDVDRHGRDLVRSHQPRQRHQQHRRAVDGEGRDQHTAAAARRPADRVGERVGRRRGSCSRSP